MLNERTVVLLAVLSLAAGSIACGSERETVRVGDDVFVAGDEAAFRGDLAGDALLAGGKVVLDGAVGGDAVLAGGDLDIRGNITQDLYAAGGELEVAGRIGGSARIAGGEIRIADTASIAGGLSAAGGRIELDGHAGEYAQIAGGKVRINGRVDGDVRVSSGELVVGPDAVIEGRLTYRGPRDARVSSAAQVRGGVVNVRDERRHGRTLERVFGWFAFVWLAGWTLVGILLLALLPGASRAVTDTVRSRPGAALLLGLAVLCVVPILIVLVAITVVGIPLALLLLLAYLLLLPLGYLAAVAAIGDTLLPRLRGSKPSTTPLRIGAFILMLVLIYLLTRIPVLGGAIAFALILAGMGGLALALAARGGRTSPAAPAT
jgi:cytoskeletal protein CcmA (bactofilin family)